MSLQLPCKLNSKVEHVTDFMSCKRNTVSKGIRKNLYHLVKFAEAFDLKDENQECGLEI